MAPGFQSSFIPKDPVAQQEVFKKKKAGPLGVLAVSLFVFTIILSGALFAYKSIIKGDIASVQSQLGEAGRNIDREKIREMTQFSKKLDFVKSIVFKHQVVSGFLNSLASSTVSSVFFTDFDYNGLTSNGLSVTLRGRTKSYGAIALQEDVFVKNKYWNSVKFSNLTLADKGDVAFEVLVSLDPQISVYAPDVPILASTSTDSADIAKDLDNFDDLDLDINDLNI